MTQVWSVIGGALAISLIASCVYRAVARARTPQGAVGWVVFLIAAPWIAVPVFLLLGRNRFRDFAIERQRSQDLRRTVATEAIGLHSDAQAHPRLRAFERLTGLPAVAGNSANLLLDGKRTFESIFEAIDSARSYVCVQFYTIADDGLGKALAAHLIAAAGRGVKVRVLYDGIGGYKLSGQYIQMLREAGIQVYGPRMSRGPAWRLQINFRNHRKTVIIDGQRAFIGGHNVADEYVDGGSNFSRWRDTHVDLRGPVVTQLQLSFVEDWHWATDEDLAEVLTWETMRDAADVTALVVPMGPGDELDTGALFFALACASATKRIWIASPYFVPDTDVSSALACAALRGVDVRVIVPENSDHFLMWLAAFAYFDPIRKAGVRIFRYAEGFMHQKVVLIDDDVACVGTANMDNRSFRLNFETMAVVQDMDFAAQVETMLKADLENSVALERDLKGQRPLVRYGAPFARLFAPIL